VLLADDRRTRRLPPPTSRRGSRSRSGRCGRSCSSIAPRRRLWVRRPAEGGPAPRLIINQHGSPPESRRRSDCHATSLATGWEGTSHPQHHPPPRAAPTQWLCMLSPPARCGGNNRVRTVASSRLVCPASAAGAISASPRLSLSSSSPSAVADETACPSAAAADSAAGGAPR
jgi:hypothetical protein